MQVRILVAEKVGSLTNIPLGVHCVCGFVWDRCVGVGGLKLYSVERKDDVTRFTTAALLFEGSCF